jgi:hypothetical protein
MRTSYAAARQGTSGGLSRGAKRGSVLAMNALGRLLQLGGLVIPLLAIFAQLAGSISVKDMLRFLIVAIGLFAVGYLLQHYLGGPYK